MVTSNFLSLGVFAMGLLSLGNCHMKMSSPVPFDVANLDNSPLKPDGSDYPCKTCGYKISAMNKIPVNEPVLLKLDGSAIHGGGTCQIAISMDEEPTKESKFKVIQTYQGDCPPKAGTGLTFNIPKDFPNAERATLAWSWFNQIGNREMYLNLAPIQITGGSDNKAYLDALPDMFVANVPATDCTTSEMSDPTIPNPGNFIIKSTDVKPKEVSGPKCGTAGPATNSNAQASEKNLAAYSPPATDSNEIIPMDGSSGSGSGNNGGSAPSAPANGGASYNNGQYTPSQPSVTAVAPSQPAASPVASTSAPAAQPSTFQTLTVPATTSTATAAYPTLSPAPNQGFAGSAATAAPAPTGATSSSGATCSTPGALVCNGPNQWGLCNNGNVVWQAVAAGTTCSNGAIQKRSTHIKRHAHGVHKKVWVA